MFIEPKYVVGFQPVASILDALNDGEEKIPRKTYKRKYKSKNDYQAEYNKKRRKKVETLDKKIDTMLANARYKFDDMEDDNGEED